jgi:hypothetical protein
LYRFWILEFLIFVYKLPQILAGLFQTKDGGEHVPKDKIHADEHVDDVKEDTIAQIFQLIDAAFKVPNNFVDWFHHFVEELLDGVGLLLLLFGFGVVLFYGRCRFVFRCWTFHLIIVYTIELYTIIRSAGRVQMQPCGSLLSSI